jgi:integrase
MKLTKATIERLRPSDKDQFVWDSETRGFGVRLTKGGVLSFVVQGHVVGSPGPSRVRITVGPFGVFSVEQARNAARELLRAMRLGIDPRSERRQREAKMEDAKAAQITLKQVAEDYYRDRSLKASSKATIERHINTTFAAWKNNPFLSITREMVKDRFSDMRDVGLRGKRGAPAQTIQAFSVLRALLNYAMDEYHDADDEPLLRKNPVNEAIKKGLWKTAAGKVRPRRNHIPITKVGEVWSALSQWRDKATSSEALASTELVAFMLLTGCRLMEGASLRWENVSLEENWWHIPDPKNKNPVWLPLSSQALALLQRRRKATTGQFVFPSWSVAGHIMDPRDVMKKVNVVAQTKQKLSNHDLRRSFTHIGYSVCGIDLHKLELLTNHGPQGVTAKHYLQTQTLQYLQGEVQRIGDWIEQQALVWEGKNVVQFVTAAAGAA